MSMLARFATIGGSVSAYIEDVFQTWLYTGNGSTQTITNGVDLAGKGGLVWIKGRSGATDHALYDTARGATKDLVSNSTAAETTQSTGLTSFSSTGFSIGALAKLNTNTATYASWTFRKQPKFFDVVTYTGNGAANRAITHNLGSVPGMVIVKWTNATSDWAVWHRSFARDEIIFLNATNAKGTGTTAWGTSANTATTFNVGIDGNGYTNWNGGTYVAYLFAHDAGGFGASGTDNVISCGSYTGDGGAGTTNITLGYEPQWIMSKRTDAAGNWVILDVMRGLAVTAGDAILQPNTSNAEAAAADYYDPTATGFKTTTSTNQNVSGATYIYIAIRRGPMRTPTTGTSVYDPEGIVTVADGQTIQTGFVTDMTMAKFNGTQEWLLSDRLRNAVLYPNTTGSEGSLYADAGPRPFDVQNGYKITSLSGNYALWGFRRAPGFFDVVCYTGTGGTGSRSLSHNLQAVPELIILKRRDAVANWQTGSMFTSTTVTRAVLNRNDDQDLNSLYTGQSIWGGQPTTSAFLIGAGGSFNTNAGTYIAYLFATVAGVSKVGSYTGTGTTQQINCGFTGGARFVLIKRTDSTGDWYVWDSARGIVAGNDPYLLLNSTAAEVTSTDYVDTFSSGFEISSTAPAAINANGGTFIFLAIA